MRSDCNAWCNVRGAGLGLWPTSDTALPEIVDAYYFVKTPGESDGCSDPSCARCARASTDTLSARH